VVAGALDDLADGYALLDLETPSPCAKPVSASPSCCSKAFSADDFPSGRTN
jgi:hypothetical protein